MNDEEIVNNYVAEKIEHYKNIYKTNLIEVHQSDNVFLSDLINKWGECFDLYESLYYIVLESCERYIKELAERNEQQTDMFLVMRELHGRALQVYREILCLLKNGYADGAYARWRTLYELTIIGFFIKQQGEQTAKSYLDYAKIDSKNYDWAKDSQVFRNKNHITFFDIENECNFSNCWYKEYKTSCKTVHANPNGTFGRISVKDDGYNYIPIGRSDFGIQLAATHSCINLSQLTVFFLCNQPTPESLIFSKCIQKWSKFIADKFIETEKDIFTDDSVTIIE